MVMAILCRGFVPAEAIAATTRKTGEALSLLLVAIHNKNLGNGKIFSFVIELWIFRSWSLYLLSGQP